MRIGKYDLVAPLGRGGMGEVWLARDRTTQRSVALKTVRYALGVDAKANAMFVDEARLASRVTHRNVAAVVDVGETEGRPYLVLELVDGPSLRALVRGEGELDRALPLGVALRIVSDTCAGLHAAHELRGADGALLGLVHRDISPHNMIVSKDGVAKLIDFGIAKARERLAGETTSSVIKGKVRYMAPEQALGGPVVDRRADVYGMGAVLFHLVVGRPPLDGPTDLGVLRELLNLAPIVVPQGIPAPVANILARALAPRLEHRYESAQALRDALEHAIDTLALAATERDVAEVVRARGATSSSEGMNGATVVAASPFDLHHGGTTRVAELRLDSDAPPVAIHHDVRVPRRVPLRQASVIAMVVITLVLVAQAAASRLPAEVSARVRDARTPRVVAARAGGATLGRLPTESDGNARSSIITLAHAGRRPTARSAPASAAVAPGPKSGDDDLTTSLRDRL